jgi:hypothetical protein
VYASNRVAIIVYDVGVWKFRDFSIGFTMVLLCLFGISRVKNSFAVLIFQGLNNILAPCRAHQCLELLLFARQRPREILVQTVFRINLIENAF